MQSHIHSLNSTAPYPDSKVHGANMGPIWGRQDPGGPHVGPMNFVIWVSYPTRLLELWASMSNCTDPLWREYTGDQWIPLTKASDSELWCFLWSAHEQMIDQIIETSVIWDANVRFETLIITPF